ncbi:MAG: DNA primase [Nitrospirae bacterium]|nr:DNA primase [Nitrospirota bacterium]
MDGYIPEELLDRIRGSQDIVEVISRHLSLKKAGQNFVGLCPFHSEKTPSFIVSPAKQLFHCFGCGTGGNIITFLMKYENLSFIDTVKKLAGDAGIRIPDSGVDSTEKDKRKKGLFEANKLAAEYYHNILVKSKEGAAARAYLSERGILPETIERFNIGYSLNSWDRAFEYLGMKGITDGIMAEAGIVVQKGKGEGYYDRFRGRVMLPILDTHKMIVGFGGRVMDNNTPKYLNSPETPLFSKRQLLYGLDIAQNYIRESGYAIIVEGYMDVIAAHQAGIQNVVGTLGTSLTGSHLKSLSRYTSEVTLTFDSDAAGISAARRSVELFLNSDMTAKVLLLPAGEDPDSYIRKAGKASFLELVNGAKGIIEFEIDRIIEKPSKLNQSDSIGGRVRVADECLALIRKVNNRIEKDYYLKKVARDLRTSEEVLRSELARKGKLTVKSSATGISDRVSGPEGLKNKPGVEEVILCLILKDTNLRRIARGVIADEDFTDIKLRKAGRYILNSEKGFHDIINDSSCEDAVKNIISGLGVCDLHIESPEKTLIDCTKVLQRNRLESELKRLEREISSAESSGMLDRIRGLQVEMQQIHRKRRFLFENN